MTDVKKTCIVCGSTSEKAILFNFEFQDNQYNICSVHLPVAIHKEHELVGKLPGAEVLLKE
jgi:hypothetical protein